MASTMAEARQTHDHVQILWAPVQTWVPLGILGCSPSFGVYHN